MQTIDHKKLTLGYQQVDFAGHWRLADLFKELSDVATLHAEKLGVWQPQMMDRYGWVVSKMHLRIFRPLKFEEDIQLTTWPSKGSRVIFPRYYQAHDKMGELCVEAVSLWTLLDLKQRRIVMPSRVGIVFPDDLAAPLTMDIETDFEEAADDVFVEERQVRYEDIDTNQHFNNARYIAWVCDLLDIERFKTHYIEDLAIYFKKETAPLEKIQLRLKEEGDRFFVRGLCQDEVRFLVEGQWKRY